MGNSPLRGLGRRALVGTACAVIGVGACFLVASLTGAALTVVVRDNTATAVPLGAAVFAAAAAGVGAYVLARLAGRTARPRRMFLVLTTAGLLASAFPPLLAATAVATAIWLLIMHAVAAVALVPVLSAGLLSRRPARQGLMGRRSARSANPHRRSAIRGRDDTQELHAAHGDA